MKGAGDGCGADGVPAGGCSCQGCGGAAGSAAEGRPNVTVDAAALTLKSGNAVLLRGSSSAYDSNTVLVAVMQDALRDTGVPADAVQLVPGRSRDSVKHLMQARGLVDVLIPRGG